MAKFLRPFRCEILTPDGFRERLEALSAVFPARDGMVGVLGGRAPLVTTIGAGGLKVDVTGTTRQKKYFIAGVRKHVEVKAQLERTFTNLGL